MKNGSYIFAIASDYQSINSSKTTYNTAIKIILNKDITAKANKKRPP